ncbi:MAG: hypothetical protein A2162_07400 [Deltaproteobacteria bacterium RBG_13_52_11b]|nr:MAG: hypothetical protein A2162_07400 [Deltaproteobacteria bacterium RBG_13_52_11b]
MGRKKWPLLILVCLLIGSGGAFLYLKKLTFLRLENLDHGRTIRLRIDPSEPFSIFYVHSIYQEPVFEEFQAEGETIVLKGVRTKSPAVMEYYGFEDMREFHPVNRRLKAITLKSGTGEGQGLIFGERKIYLRDYGEKGDRIRLSLESIPMGEYLRKELM